jgi:hypothetical protein
MSTGCGVVGDIDSFVLVCALADNFLPQISQEKRAFELIDQ